jgi:hypothetical protein
MCMCARVWVYIEKKLFMWIKKERVSVRVRNITLFSNAVCMYTSKCIPALCTHTSKRMCVSLFRDLPSSMVAAKTAIASRRRSNLCCQVLNLRPLLLSAKQNSKKKLFSNKNDFSSTCWYFGSRWSIARKSQLVWLLKKLKKKSLFLLFKNLKKI